MQTKIQKPVKASLAYFFASVLQQGMNFLTIPIFTRILSTMDYGVINVFNAWYGVLLIIITLAPWGGMFNNGMVEFKDQRVSFTSSLMQLSLLNSATCGAFFFLFSSPISSVMGISDNLLYIMIVRFASDAIVNLWLAQQRYEYRYINVLIVSSVTAVLNPILALFAIFYFPGNKGELKILFSAVPALIVACILFVQYKYRDSSFVNYRYWKYAISLNVPLLPHFVSGALLSQSDRIMIARFCGEEKAGVYGVAYSLAAILNVVLAAINGALVPFAYQCLEKKAYKALGKLINCVLLIITIACILIMLLAPEAIKILAPETYYEAIYAIPPVAAGVFFSFLYGIFVNIEYFYKQNKNVMYATMAAAAINILLNAIFIPIFGFIAAAYTTLVGYLVLSIMHYLLAKHILSPLPYNILPILICSFVVLLMMVISVVLYRFIIVRYTIVALFIVGAIICFIKFDLIKSLLQKQ